MNLPSTGVDADELLRLDTVAYELAFLVVLLAFSAVIVADAVTYPAQARLLPLVFGGATIAVLLVVIGRKARGLEGLHDRNLDDEALAYRGRVVRISGWVLVLLGAVYVLGFLGGLAVSLVAMYRVLAGRSWPWAVGYAAVILATIYAIFVVVLHVPLYAGLLG